MERVLVSACLLGRAVRFDGGAKPCDDGLLQRWRLEGRLVPVCPEVSGGLPVPRPPAEIDAPAGGDGRAVVDGHARVIAETGVDVTAAFLEGARLALAVAHRHGCRMAILKEASPSCARSRIHDGRFAGATVSGVGVTTALLERNGIRVFSEEDLPSAEACLQHLENGAKNSDQGAENRFAHLPDC